MTAAIDPAAMSRYSCARLDRARRPRRHLLAQAGIVRGRLVRADAGVQAVECCIRVTRTLIDRRRLYPVLALLCRTSPDYATHTAGGQADPFGLRSSTGGYRVWTDRRRPATVRLTGDPLLNRAVTELAPLAPVRLQWKRRRRPKWQPASKRADALYSDTAKQSSSSG